MAYHLINLYFRCSIRNIPLTNSYSIAVTVNSLLRLENEVTQYQSFVIIVLGLDLGVSEVARDLEFSDSKTIMGLSKKAIISK